MARQAEVNQARANRSQSVDARPTKIHKGFDIGDVVYVSDEYLVRACVKHPKGYNRKTAFAIVKLGIWQGCWHLCAKKDIRSQLERLNPNYITKGQTPLDVKQMQIQLLYKDGLLSDVPAHYLVAYPTPPARGNQSEAWVDLRPR